MNIMNNISMPRLHNSFTLTRREGSEKISSNSATAYNVVFDKVYKYLMRQTTSETRERSMFILLGNGTGELDATRAGLFSQVTSKAVVSTVTKKSNELYEVTAKLIISETENIGLEITEIGISMAPIGTYNHALFQDSEGNQITIGPKTNTEIWEIDIIFYIESLPGSVVPADMANFLGNSGSWRITGDFITGTIYPNSIALPRARDAVAVDNITTSDVLSIAATAGNGEYNTQDILCFKYNMEAGVNMFPNHDVFPPFQFSERTIGTGDGENRGFNLDSGFFIPGTLVVKVDGVVQSEDTDYVTNQGARQILNRVYYDYVYPYGIDYSGKIYTTDADKSNPVLHYSTMNGASYMYTPNLNLLFDFEKVVKLPYCYARGYSDIARSLDLYHSIDGETWEGPIKNAAIKSTEVLIEGLTDLEVRYLWMKADTTTTNTRSQKSYPIRIMGKESIIFNEPPAQGANITASWQTEIPPKNANMFYEVQTSFKYSW